MADIIINEKYRADRKIGEGGFGFVYAGTFFRSHSAKSRLTRLGTDIQSNEEVAMKLMHVRDDSDIVESEAKTYNALSGGVGIPRVLWFGQECDYYVLVHDLLGPSLEDLLNYCDRRFSLKTILLIGDQAISRIEYIHSQGLLHRDIKPDNFLMGVGKQGNILYTIDFGLAKEFCDAEQDRRWETRAFGGTSRYASLNNHNGREQSRGDDLESLGYVLLYFARGRLPWQGLRAASNKEKNELIKEKKTTLLVEELCVGLPEEFATYLNYTRSLGFEDRPDYAYLRQLFRRLFQSKGFKYDNIFDWTEKRFHEMKSQAAKLAENLPHSSDH
ncbi:casein kinase I isoform delta [Diaporthe sp. PMI_573]|nr:casein kinase I isoform delta [Diaporthaceae sp. PMI_573]